MRLNRLLPALLLLPLIGGCSYSRMPDWLVRMMGGPERSGKYVDGPLTEAYVVERAKLKLPPLTQDGAIRLQVAPSFGLYDYVLDFTPQPAGCLMMWNIRDLSEADIKRRCQIIAARIWRSASENKGPTMPVESRAFYLSTGDYQDALQSFNERLEGWKGFDGLTLDGTWIGFEQVHGNRLRSMTDNVSESPAENPLPQLVRDMQRLALAYGPAGFFPRSYDWHSIADSDNPCSGGLAGTDPDGMGTGDDACAAWLKARPR